MMERQEEGLLKNHSNLAAYNGWLRLSFRVIQLNTGPIVARLNPMGKPLNRPHLTESSCQGRKEGPNYCWL